MASNCDQPWTPTTSTSALPNFKGKKRLKKNEYEIRTIALLLLWAPIQDTEFNCRPLTEPRFLQYRIITITRIPSEHNHTPLSTKPIITFVLCSLLPLLSGKMFWVWFENATPNDVSGAKYWATTRKRIL